MVQKAEKHKSGRFVQNQMSCNGRMRGYRWFHLRTIKRMDAAKLDDEILVQHFV